MIFIKLIKKKESVRYVFFCKTVKWVFHNSFSIRREWSKVSLKRIEKRRGEIESKREKIGGGRQTGREGGREGGKTQREEAKEEEKEEKERKEWKWKKNSYLLNEKKNKIIKQSSMRKMCV